MSRELYACVHAAELPAQALLRLRPELRAQPVVVLEGPAAQQTVCALNQRARRRGAAPGMARLDAESLPEMKLLRRSPQAETVARSILLECVSQFSPRIEDALPDALWGEAREADQATACAFVLDIQGTERLFGAPEQLAQRLRSCLSAAGFHVSIAVSANFHTARLAAAHRGGIRVIAAGQEAAMLAGLPLTALGRDAASDADLTEILAHWGIRNLGELAALPEAELVTRLGAKARAWSALAQGRATHLFRPIQPALRLEEFCAFETPVAQMDSLLFTAARMIDCLVQRAESRALALAAVTALMQLEDGSSHQRAIRPALPSLDRRFLLKLVQMEIGAHPPQAAVTSLLLQAEPGRSRQMQLGLFAPRMPEPSRLDVTLARLKLIVGEDRVGSPVLEDTHRADSFHMLSLMAERAGAGQRPQNISGQAPEAPERQFHRLCLRRMRPPRPVNVLLRAGRPAAFHDRKQSFKITAAYGPWNSSGCWWSAAAWQIGPEPHGSAAWSSAEWDVLATSPDGSPCVCLLNHDPQRNTWHLEAFYD
ncbi:MAG: DNA polymerase Y family protein [Acidobacteriota bacterium]